MFGAGPSKDTQRKLNRLEAHLKKENERLVDVVKTYRKLDRIGYRMGLLSPEQSYATQISWWPLISVLGTFSAGKSSFLNHYFGLEAQASGTQAVDDKFSVLVYSNDGEIRELPGNALDSDPRFPFFQIGDELEKVAPGHGDHVDSFLRLKTCPSDNLRGKILIDSPGFDADWQRTATLRITDYIVDLSDLVLVFFDARHPEPGAMQDTLDHLVATTIRRQDSSKFLYVLNQIDTTAQEDNPEDVVSAWQRALASEGLTTGRFYTIYNPDRAVEIPDAYLKERFERKRDEDLEEIHRRMDRVDVERVYRVIGGLDRTVQEIEQQWVPILREAMDRWRRGVWWRDGVSAVVALLGLGALSVERGFWDGLRFAPPDWFTALFETPQGAGFIGLLVVLIALWAHFTARQRSAIKVRRWLAQLQYPPHIIEQLHRAFHRSTRAWRSVLERRPAGWNRRTRKRLRHISDEADRHIQSLNERFADPSGEKGGRKVAADSNPQVAPVSEPDSGVSSETNGVKDAEAVEELDAPRSN